MKKTIIDYFEETVRRFPDRIAVTDRNTAYTYHELDLIAKNLALTITGEAPAEKPIAIYLKQGAELTAAILAVLHTNHCYVVLDYDSPKERLNRILKTLKPAAVLLDPKAEATFRESVAEAPVPVPILFSKSTEELSREELEKLKKARKNVTGESPAYVLFTSGSTGDPKGAVVTHNNVISYISWFTDCFSIDEEASFGAQTPLHFSMSVSDFYGSMFTGGCYNLIPKDLFGFPAKLIDYLNEKQINTLYWVPSAMGIVTGWDLFRYTKPLYVKQVLFAGEAMPVKYLNYWKSYLPDASFANLFGPTETTDICTYYKVDRDFAVTEALPIGWACDNCELFLVDPDTGEAAEYGCVGELYVKGPFVAKGYFGNEEKTREAFVQNPFHADYPDMVYKTGDLVRYNKKGELLYLGRKDYQIKHMGYRIEPGEVETVLNGFDTSMMTVCLYDEESDRLVLVYEAGKERGKELAGFALTNLPLYMRPEQYERMDRLPVSPNGKIDRKRIRAEVLNKK